MLVICFCVAGIFREIIYSVGAADAWRCDLPYFDRVVGGCRRRQLPAVLTACLYGARRTSALSAVEGLPFDVCVTGFFVFCAEVLRAVALRGGGLLCILISID